MRDLHRAQKAASKTLHGWREVKDISLTVDRRDRQTPADEMFAVR